MGKNRREREGEDVRIINWFYELKKTKISKNRHTRRGRGVLLSGFVSFFCFFTANYRTPIIRPSIFAHTVFFCYCITVRVVVYAVVVEKTKKEARGTRLQAILKNNLIFVGNGWLWESKNSYRWKWTALTGRRWGGTRSTQDLRHLFFVFKGGQFWNRNGGGKVEGREKEERERFQDTLFYPRYLETVSLKTITPFCSFPKLKGFTPL